MRSLLLVMFLVSCESSGGRMHINSWESNIVLTAPHRMGGCAIGDIDADRAGNEIVATCATGDLLLAYRDQGAWKQKAVFHSEGELILCSTGRLLPGVKGEQIVAAGMIAGEEDEKGPGQVVLVWKEGGAWKSERVWATDRLAHAAIVTRIDGVPAIAAGDYGKRVVLIRRGERTGKWNAETIFTSEAPIKHMVEGHFDPADPRRLGLAVVDTGGAVTVIAKTGGEWKHEQIYKSSKGLNRIGCAPGRSGGPDRVAVAGNGCELVLLTHDEEKWQTRILYRSTAKLRGVAFLNDDMIVTADYDGNVTVSSGEVIFKETGAIHHVSAGDVGGIPSIVACGHAGRCLLLQRR